MDDLPFWPAAAFWWLSIGLTAAVMMRSSDGTRAVELRVQREFTTTDLLILALLGPIVPATLGISWALGWLNDAEKATPDA